MELSSHGGHGHAKFTYQLGKVLSFIARTQQCSYSHGKFVYQDLRLYDSWHLSPWSLPSGITLDRWSIYRMAVVDLTHPNKLPRTVSATVIHALWLNLGCQGRKSTLPWRLTQVTMRCIFIKFSHRPTYSDYQNTEQLLFWPVSEQHGH
jgi:hypothetical protein